jgi:hypothetical protein
MRPRLGIARSEPRVIAAQYQAFVFSFARTWESIYLNFDLDAHAVPAAPALSVAFQVELLEP